jgi:hypothetical protein
MALLGMGHRTWLQVAEMVFENSQTGFIIVILKEERVNR